MRTRTARRSYLGKLALSQRPRTRPSRGYGEISLGTSVEISFSRTGSPRERDAIALEQRLRVPRKYRTGGRSSSDRNARASSVSRALTDRTPQQKCGPFPVSYAVPLVPYASPGPVKKMVRWPLYSLMSQLETDPADSHVYTHDLSLDSRSPFVDLTAALALQLLRISRLRRHSAASRRTEPPAPLLDRRFAAAAGFESPESASGTGPQRVDRQPDRL